MSGLLVRFDRWFHARRCRHCRTRRERPYDPAFDAAFDEVYRR